MNEQNKNKVLLQQSENIPDTSRSDRTDQRTVADIRSVCGMGKDI